MASPLLKMTKTSNRIHFSYSLSLLVRNKSLAKQALTYKKQLEMEQVIQNQFALTNH